MESVTSDQKNELLDRLTNYVRERQSGPDSQDLEQFVRRYYAQVGLDELAGRTIDALYGAALSLWKFSKARPENTPIVRLYNPRVEEHGWKSPHTVVEIVNDDMPFLVDSVTMELTRKGHTVHQIVHPVINVLRDPEGELRGLDGGSEDSADGTVPSVRESLMHLEIDEQSAVEVLDTIRGQIMRVLVDVRVAVQDWRSMLDQLDTTVQTLVGNPPPVDVGELEEAVEFLAWLGDNHFTLLGYREYDFLPDADGDPLSPVDNSGLGILRDPNRLVLQSAGEDAHTTSEIQAFLREPNPIIITKTNLRAVVHRPVYMDYVGVKRFDKAGNMIGECRFVGLFTSAAYNRNPGQIPLLRSKVERIMKRAGFAPTGHDGKALLNILETYPRDELFQSSDDQLLETSLDILRLQERPRPRLFLRPDQYRRFVTALVYVPRERYDTTLRQRIEGILSEAYDGSIVAHYTLVGDSVLARLHLIIGVKAGGPVPDGVELEARVTEAARSWSDVLHQALTERWGEEQGNLLAHRYVEGFSAAYREAFSPDVALSDIAKIETLSGDTAIALNFYRNIDDPDEAIRFKIYHREGLIPLSDCLPMLESLGFKVLEEHPYGLASRTTGDTVSIHDFHMLDPTGHELDLGALKGKFEDAFGKVWAGEIDNDGFNRLVMRAQLSWRDIVVLRAFCKYLRQVGIPYSQPYMEDTLAAHPAIACQLIELFHTRFDPSAEKDRDRRTQKCVAVIAEALDRVTSLDEDRIIRRYLNLVLSTLRTNYFQTDADGAPKPYVSFKFDSNQIDELPLPRPFVEVYVYSPRVEAIHLRGGKVARGGIRWSDRREDFRTEVLGLMKAQMVKNVVIVPVGAKGGFVAKRLFSAAAAGTDTMTEVVECYQTFMRGLLDITDNLVSGDVVHPARVVRHDDDDPYLVVAADKGTATFSDIANGVAAEYDFWLGDAFASGGSAGYDHKQMGITARGAWESVKRHFREIGIDVHQTPFTAVGIGDMSGDVFGNGLLMSDQTRLQAAFDHRNIFVDPDPDPAAGFVERQRLYDLPRSSWADYDAKLISKGGGIFDRHAKSIQLTPEIKKLLSLSEDNVAPNDLVRAILKAEADLLWIGGIGTYVRSNSESNAEAGDRANDAVRVDGGELRCKVLGEGGNLGLTQRGRIEYARKGGRLNTDAVDNSGGVDCSDREVNIKILLNAEVADGELTMKQRDRLLKDMTDDVAELVLVDNYRQSEAITLLDRSAPELLESHSRFMRTLQRDGKLDREVEHLPGDEELAERAADHAGLSRPELSVVLAYGKMILSEDLLESDLPDDTYLNADLVRAFPKQLRKKYKTGIQNHPLRRELMATVVANSLINRVGPSFLTALNEESGFGVGEIGRAYVIARDAFDLRELWRAIGELDNQVSADVQTAMLADISSLLRRASVWFLNRATGPLDIGVAMKEFQPGITELCGVIGDLLSDFEAEAYARRKAKLIADGVPEWLAGRVTALDPLASSCDIVGVANQLGQPVPDVARVYFTLGSHLGLDWLRASAEDMEQADHWDRLAVSALIEDFFGQQQVLTCAALTSANGDDPVASWSKNNAAAAARCRDLIDDLKSGSDITLAKLTYANRRIRSLIRE
jgi:glutamate dehydrogenase